MNHKIRRSRLKLVKATKSLPETTNQLNAKKRRQKVRRTVQFLFFIYVLNDYFSLQGFQIRDEDFTVIFKDLPLNEQLIIGM
jgi:hypothetical protein